MQIPRKAESFSSLSLMFLRDVHLGWWSGGGGEGGGKRWGISPWGWGTVDIYGGHWGAAAGQWVVGLGWGKQEVRAQWGWIVYPWVGRAGLDGYW